MKLAKRDPQQTIDMLIDEIGEQSFPASDPPAWGAVASRIAQVKLSAGSEERDLRSSAREPSGYQESAATIVSSERV